MCVLSFIVWLFVLVFFCFICFDDRVYCFFDSVNVVHVINLLPLELHDENGQQQ